MAAGKLCFHLGEPKLRIGWPERRKLEGNRNRSGPEPDVVLPDVVLPDVEAWLLNVVDMLVLEELPLVDIAEVDIAEEH